jgi:hypothetical protein
MATLPQPYDDDHDLAPVIPLFRNVVDLDEDDYYDEHGLILRFVDGYPGGPHVS